MKRKSYYQQMKIDHRDQLLSMGFKIDSEGKVDESPVTPSQIAMRGKFNRFRT